MVYRRPKLSHRLSFRLPGGTACGAGFRADKAAFVLGAAFCMAPSDSRGAEDGPELAPYYGFQPIEIYKVDDRSSDLKAADLTGDGRLDLLSVDNGHSRLDLLRQREQPSETGEKAPTGEVNFVPNSWRYEHVKVPVEREIISLVTGDFNGDGRTDLAYVGSPDRLIVRLAVAGKSPEDWPEASEQRLPDLVESGILLATGDLNGDGRADLAVLGKQKTYVVLQTVEGKLAPPEALMNTSDSLALAQVADVDGDGHDDLCYTASDGGERILCARLQTPRGGLGPEIRFPLNRPRSVSLADVDRQPGREILTIDSTTGRLQISKVKKPEAKPGELAGRLVQFGFGDQSTRNERDLALGDVDGDGRTDIVVTDPAAAQMIVFRQRPGSGLDLGETFPGLTGAEQVRAADLDTDGAAEVLVLSEKEGVLGECRFEDGRLTFPKPLPVGSDPLAFELTDLNGDGKLELLVIAKGSGSGKYAFRAYRYVGEEWKPLPVGGKESIEVALAGSPKRLVNFDCNRDGQPDFAVFFGLGRAAQIFLSDPKEGLAELKTPTNIGIGDVPPGAFSTGTLVNPEADGERPALLLAQGNFVRNLTLEKGRWRVVDQYNAVETGAKIESAATLDLDGQPGNEIVLVDTGVRKLRVLKADGSLYKPWKEVEIGSFPFVSARVADLNSDKRDDLLLFGRGRLAVLYAGQTDPKLEEVATYESDLDDTFFVDAVAGDLNGDGFTDIALLDTQSHFVEVLDVDPAGGPRHATHFRVFEEKSFHGGDGGGVEPREAVIADVTGDGKADLVLLVHDRILVYPQDPGPAARRHGGEMMTIGCSVRGAGNAAYRRLHLPARPHPAF